MEAIDLLRFLANVGAPHGLKNLYSPVVFIFGVGLIFSGLFTAQKSDISLITWLLPSGIGVILVVQSFICRELVRLQDRYDKNEFLIYRAVVGTMVISLWVSAIKTTIEFIVKYGGVN